MSPESEIKIDQNAEKSPIRIARAVLVAPISVPEILGLLRSGIPVRNIPFSEVVLIQKSEDSARSAGLVMAVGGEVDPEEERMQGVLREVGEEVTATSLAEGLTKLRWEDDKKNKEEYPYKFSIGNDIDKREMSMYVLPVQSRSVFPHEPRESESGRRSKDKIGNVLHLTPAELGEIITNGFIKKDGKVMRAAGHFTIADETTITINDEDKAQREKALQKVINDVNTFDQQLRQATLMQINLVRRIKRESDVEDLSLCSPEEIARGFVGAQLRLALADEKRREARNGSNQLDSLLKIPPYLATELPAEELSDLLYSIPNKEGRRAMKVLTEGFSKGAEVIIARFQEPEPEPQISGRLCREEELRSVWSQFLELPVDERVGLIKRANKVTIDGIIEEGGGEFIKDDVDAAIKELREWHDYYTNEIRSVQDTFQEHRPMNEILNSLLFEKMLYAIGLHPNRAYSMNGQDVLQRLRLEAVRDMAVFLTNVEAAKLEREADISLFLGALDTFFHFPPTPEFIDLGKGREQPVYHRETVDPVNGQLLHVLVDERPKKTIRSIARKRFLSPEVQDIYSINFVLADDNFKGSREPFDDRAETAEAFRDNLIAHVQEQLSGSGWSVSILDGTHKRKVIEEARAVWMGMREGNTEPKGGKRPGSKGDAIIREKFILCMENEQGRRQMLEVCIYPFQSSGSGPVRKLSRAHYWGFAEKIVDDAEGVYKGERLVQRDDGHPTQPSLHERFFPGRYFPRMARRLRERHIISRKDRIKNNNVVSEGT